MRGYEGGPQEASPEGEERRSQGTKVACHLFHRLPMTDNLERRREEGRREGGGGGGGGGEKGQDKTDSFHWHGETDLVQAYSYRVTLLYGNADERVRIEATR